MKDIEKRLLGQESSNKSGNMEVQNKR